MSFNFGTPASSGASSGSIFGTAGSAFGSNPKTSNPGSGLFGNVGASSTSGSPSIFGSQNQTGATQQSTPMFGNTQTPGKTDSATPNQSGGNTLFGGSAAAGGNLFGNAGSSATPAQTGASLFGKTSTTPAGPPPGSKTPSIYGGLNTSSSTTPSTTAPSSTTPVTSQSQPTGGLFGAGSGASAAKPLFGTTPAASAPSTGIFGNSNKPAVSNTSTTTAESTPKPLFGAAAPATSTTSSAQAPSLFAPSGDSAKPTFSLGGASPAPATTAAPQKSPFPSLGGTTSSAAPLSTAKPASMSLNLLSGLGGAAPSTTGSITGTTATTSAPSSTSTTQPVAAKPSFFGSAATSTPSTQPAPAATTSLFGNAATSTPSSQPTTTTSAGDGKSATATAAPATTTKTTTGADATLGQSTTGPAPPAQSRLKNKTMDEIITRWATDLTKYQKEFREQAEKVSEWDRMLVENGNKVQKLYGSAVDADRATQEVERQLASVEGQQEELSSWLDRYEREVDEMVAKQVGPGETLQGPDQDRERTYKLAEKLSERLDEMGKDLTSMIEEVNSASATLSKTNRADEPISQIVRILNSHLSQLQVIDQGTSELQAKVAAAQKAGQSISSRFGYGLSSPGMGSGNAADDFYRSFMGRR